MNASVCVLSHVYVYVHVWVLWLFLYVDFGSVFSFFLPLFFSVSSAPRRCAQLRRLQGHSRYPPGGGRRRPAGGEAQEPAAPPRPVATRRTINFMTLTLKG